MSRAVGPCADSSALVPGSLLCEKTPTQPSRLGKRDGAHDAIAYEPALPEHDVAP